MKEVFLLFFFCSNFLLFPLSPLSIFSFFFVFCLLLNFVLWLPGPARPLYNFSTFLAYVFFNCSLLSFLYFLSFWFLFSRIFIQFSFEIVTYPNKFFLMNHRQTHQSFLYKEKVKNLKFPWKLISLYLIPSILSNKKYTFHFLIENLIEL